MVNGGAGVGTADGAVATGSAVGVGAIVGTVEVATGVGAVGVHVGVGTGVHVGAPGVGVAGMAAVGLGVGRGVGTTGRSASSARPATRSVKKSAAVLDLPYQPKQKSALGKSAPCARTGRAAAEVVICYPLPGP